MFFDPKLLCVRENGRFAKSWLAATNPKAFKTFTSYEIQQIKVSVVCDEIREMSKIHSTRRMSLYLTAQLVFGTVRIYQQQVLHLYENAKNLVTCQQVLLQNIDFKRPPVPILTVPPKKRKCGNIKSVPLDDVYFDDTISEADSFATSTCNIDKYTLRQTILNPVEDDEEELFGEIKGKEMDEFLSVLEGRTSMRELCRTPLPNLNGTSDADSIAKDRSGIRTEEVEGNDYDDDSVESIEVARSAYIPNIHSSRASFDNVLSTMRQFEIGTPNKTKTTTTNNDLQNEDLQESSNQIEATYSPIPQLMEMEFNEQIDFQQSPQGIPDLLPLSKNTVLIIGQRKRRKRKHLQIDPITMIPSETFFKNANDTEKSTCCNIVPYWKLHFRSNDALFKSPCRRILSKKLLSNFTRHTKVKSMETDFSILSSVNEHHEILPNVQKRQRSSAIQRFEFQQEADTRIDSGIDFPEQLEHDLMESFMENRENMEDGISHNRVYQSKMRVLRKLWCLWEDKIFPIQMSLLCEDITRLKAANTFFSVLELCAHRYVKLCRDENTTEICHIAMGDRLINSCVSNS